MFCGTQLISMVGGTALLAVLAAAPGHAQTSMETTILPFTGEVGDIVALQGHGAFGAAETVVSFTEATSGGFRPRILLGSALGEWAFALDEGPSTARSEPCLFAHETGIYREAAPHRPVPNLPSPPAMRFRAWTGSAWHEQDVALGLTRPCEMGVGAADDTGALYVYLQAIGLGPTTGSEIHVVEQQVHRYVDTVVYRSPETLRNLWVGNPSHGPAILMASYGTQFIAGPFTAQTAELETFEVPGEVLALAGGEDAHYVAYAEACGTRPAAVDEHGQEHSATCFPGTGSAILSATSASTRSWLALAIDNGGACRAWFGEGLDLEELPARACQVAVVIQQNLPTVLHSREGYRDLALTSLVEVLHLPQDREPPRNETSALPLLWGVGAIVVGATWRRRGTT